MSSVAASARSSGRASSVSRKAAIAAAGASGTTASGLCGVCARVTVIGGPLRGALYAAHKRRPRSWCAHPMCHGAQCGTLYPQADPHTHTGTKAMSENLALNLTDSAQRGAHLPAVRLDDAVLSYRTLDDLTA